MPRDSSGSLHSDCSISIVSSDTVKKTASPKTVPRLRTSCKTRKTQQKISAKNSYPSPDHNFTCTTIGEGADSSQYTTDSSSKYVPQRSLLCELPQDVSNLTTFKNRLSPRGDGCLRHTGALGPQHPLIRDWYHKKRASAVTVPSLLNRYELSLSDSSLATHSKTMKGSFTTHHAERIGDASSSQSYKPPDEDKGYKKTGRLYDSTHCGSTVERKSREMVALEKQGFSETSSGSTTTLPSIDRPGSNRFTVVSAATHAREDSSMESSERETEEIFGDIGGFCRCRRTGSQDQQGCSDGMEKKKRASVGELRSIATHMLALQEKHGCHLYCETQKATTDSDDVSSSRPYGLSKRPLTTTSKRGSHRETCPDRFVDKESGSKISLEPNLASLARIKSNSSSSSNGGLTSLPVLPLIRNKPCKDSSNTSGRSLAGRASDCTCVYSSNSGRNLDHCSVVNLRIPLGSRQEWDVPHFGRDCSLRNQEDEAIGRHSSESKGREECQQNQSEASKLELSTTGHSQKRLRMSA